MSEEIPAPPVEAAPEPADASSMLASPSGEASAPPLDLHPVPSWAEQFSPELREMVATKQYGDPESLAQAYMHASQKLGKNPESLLEIPSDWSDTEAAGKVWDQLGRPASASDYTIEFGESEQAQQIGTRLSSKAWELGLTQDQWQGVVSEFTATGVEINDTMGEQKQQEAGQKSAAEMAEVRQLWGDNFDANLQRGRSAVRALGLEDSDIQAIEAQRGTKGVLEWAYNLSRVVGEHAVETGDSQQAVFHDGESALAEYKRMSSDPAVVKARNAGDETVTRKLDQLIDVISGAGLRIS